MSKVPEYITGSRREEIYKEMLRKLDCKPEDLESKIIETIGLPDGVEFQRIGSDNLYQDELNDIRSKCARQERSLWIIRFFNNDDIRDRLDRAKHVFLEITKPVPLSQMNMLSSMDKKSFNMLVGAVISETLDRVFPERFFREHQDAIEKLERDVQNSKYATDVTLEYLENYANGTVEEYDTFDTNKQMDKKIAERLISELTEGKKVEELSISEIKELMQSLKDRPNSIQQDVQEKIDNGLKDERPTTSETIEEDTKCIIEESIASRLEEKGFKNPQEMEDHVREQLKVPEGVRIVYMKNFPMWEKDLKNVLSEYARRQRAVMVGNKQSRYLESFDYLNVIGQIFFEITKPIPLGSIRDCSWFGERQLEGVVISKELGYVFPAAYYREHRQAIEQSEQGIKEKLDEATTLGEARQQTVKGIFNEEEGEQTRGDCIETAEKIINKHTEGKGLGDLTFPQLQKLIDDLQKDAASLREQAQLNIEKEFDKTE